MCHHAVSSSLGKGRRHRITISCGPLRYGSHPGPCLKPGQLLPKNTWLIEPPPNGKAVVISVGFSRIPKGEAVITPDVRELGHSRLSTGEYVVVFARLVDFDYEAFKAQHQQQSRSRSGQGHLIASEEQILSVKHPRMFGLAATDGIRPADEIETMLAVQMIGTYETAMDMLMRAKQADIMPTLQECGSLAVKLFRTYTAQVEALVRLRRGGEQRVIVQHVNVNEGGQAIVGAVNHPRGSEK
jgi:hypothetical protein